MGFNFEAIEAYKKDLWNLAEEQFPILKDKCLNRMGLRLSRNITKFVPRDTGNLRASLDNHRLIGNNTVRCATDVEYAQAVNDGHIQRKRFLPAKYLTSVSGRKYLGEDNTKGIMLKEKFIPGVHFMEKGLQITESEIEEDIDLLINEVKAAIKG